jgi:ABC-type polar amino acid transport system ATPase subunit
MVRIRGLVKRFGGREVLRGIDLDVAAGTVMCVIGPSGSGKSTLLACINHLERIDGGRLWVGGTAAASTNCRNGRWRGCASASAWCSSTSICSRI